MKKIILSYIILLFCSQGFTQRVGVVFSGGGATGFAHIGVLKALEEHNIPIDFITGTSAGALIGAMYASGFSPLEIEKIVLDEKFQLMSSGKLEEASEYTIHKQNMDAELMSFRFAKDSIFQKSLPTNILNPTFLDFEVLNLLGDNLSIGGGSFDSLFVPFRCVASNIATKESILFKNGNLNQAVRASMTYPFFISPIEVNGVLMFDGGLYNNFPATEMYTEFDPDFIIGSNVSYNEAPPQADDLMSQIKNMFSSYSDYGLPCESGIVIEPDLGEIGTFDFDRIEEAIQIGYDATIKKIDSIKYYIQIRVSDEELAKSRAKYKKKRTKMLIAKISVIGLDENESRYIRKKLLNTKKNEILTYAEIKKRYLRLYQSEHILSMFPMLKPITDSTQELIIDFRKEKSFKAAFGGHYSSRPVNTGFLSLSYADFKVTPITLYANTYFGKFYGSVKTGVKFYLPTKTTSYIEPSFVMNRWDYFKSFATFFEDSRPSYLVVNERFWSVKYVIPASSKSKLIFDFSNGSNENSYYQTDEFTQLDTTDNTSFLYYSPGFEFVIDKLNRKQFESAGSRFSIKSRFIHGIETTVPGSTSSSDETSKTFKNWFYIKANFKNYFIQKGLYRLGIQLEGVYSTQPFFENYTASILSSHAFQPIPDSKTGFYNDFRANKYFGGGLVNIFTLKDKLDLRIEAYIFQPIYRILSDEDGIPHEGPLFNNRFGIASVSLIYHSVIGPIRGTVNYFDSQSQLKPLSFQMSLGYVIFNNRGIK